MSGESRSTGPDIVVQRLSLSDFKAFERFTLNLRGDAYLAGPNNAGKSTLIAALRAAAQIVRIGMRRGPTETFMDRSEQVLGYVLRPTNIPLDDENLHHEFRDSETRLSVGFTNGAAVTAVWPPEGGGDPFFYLQHGRASVNNVRQARDAFPELLTAKYVRDNLEGRLASRHFRNQLLVLQVDNEYDSFVEFAAPWLPEIRLRSLQQHYGDKSTVLDLYYRESGRRAEKEIVWAGDGIQIWLQLLPPSLPASRPRRHRPRRAGRLSSS